MKKQFISKKKIKELQEGLNWLENITPVNEVEFMVCQNENGDNVDIEFTQFLQELAVLNLRRQKLIKLLS